ncbi:MULTISPECIES: hypothetical protein [Pseudomonas syringae group]|uniref:Uncharacterized protein n=1 Tax=Pseudomonas syringae pv. castaneae TaxID=264450 RepID=A0A0P9S2K0_PSESX|nr:MULTISPECIES: hypothetical protein [Pseudomonas syringae group]KPW91785.1 Uncharacterized protein ALO79_02152 [Pseudomonas syringae pv. castaneae]
MSNITNTSFYENLFLPGKMPTKCLLCTEGKLHQLGHIIPKFAMRWIKDAGKLKDLHFNNTEDKMVDTPAIRMMCEACETKISLLEKCFTDNYFKRYYRKQPMRSMWDELYAFSISVAWRILASSRILKDTEMHIKEYDEAFSSIESRARSFLMDTSHKCDIAVYVFSADEILNNLSVDKYNKSLLLFSIRQGLKAHNFYDNSGFFTLSFGRVPIIAFKIGFLYFFVVDTGYFRNVPFFMKAVRSPATYDLYTVEFTDGFLGFMDWCFELGLYEVDSSCIPKANYARRNT